MRNILLALAFLAPAGQEPAPPANRPCDLSSVEEGFWCPKCGMRGHAIVEDGVVTWWDLLMTVGHAIGVTQMCEDHVMPETVPPEDFCEPEPDPGN